MKQEKIVFQNSKGQKLVGILYSPDYRSKFPAIIFAPGFGSTKETRKATVLIKRIKNSIFFTIDFYGRGESYGKLKDMTLTEEIDDLKNAIDYVYKLDNVDKRNIIVIGSSFGGLVSLIHASKDDRIQKLILITPALLGTKEYTALNKDKKRKMKETFYEDLNKYNSFKYAERVRCETFIIHGTKDKSVPIEISKRLVKIITNAKLEIIEGADHGFTNPAHFRSMINLILEFCGEIE